MSRRTHLIAIVVATATVSGTAHAGGLFIPGVGSQAMGRAGAFVAKADDPSALHHNPAGFAKVKGMAVHLGSNLVDFSLEFTRDGVYEDVEDMDLPWEGDAYPTVTNDAARPSVGIGPLQAIPLIAVGSDLKGTVPGLSVGLGVVVPNSYPVRNIGADYQLEDPDAPPPPSRYDVVAQEAATALPSVAAAYSIGDYLDIGARFSFGFANVQAISYTWAVPNFHEAAAEDGVFEVEVSDNFVPGFGFGLLFRPPGLSDRLEIGAAYSSALHIQAQGQGRTTLGSVAADPLNNGNVDQIIPVNTPACADGGEVGALATCLNLTLPQTATLGVRWVLQKSEKHGELADIELDVKWEDWSAASDTEIIVDGRSEQTGLFLNPSIIRHGFQDVISVRLGGSYSIPMGENLIGVRAGVAHDTAAAPNSWQRLDIDGAARTTIALGAAYQSKRYRIDIGGGMVMEGDRTVEACNPANNTEGCTPGSEPLPVAERTAPDPIQPLVNANQQFQSPFNGGQYSSGYLMVSLGVTTWF